MWKRVGCLDGGLKLCAKSTDRSHAQLLLTIVSLGDQFHTHSPTHSNAVHQDVPALYDLRMRGRFMVLRVHTNIMGSRGYLVLRHAIMAQGTLECNIVLLYMILFQIKF